MEKRITLLIPGRASSRLIKPRGKPAYFKSLYVNPRFRRRGYGLELMKFASEYMREFLEMDILYGAKECQRNAARLGYRKIGRPSDRFSGCALWQYYGVGNHFAPSRLKILRKITYQRRSGRTEVLYLSNSLI